MTLTAPDPRSAAPEPWSPRSPVELLADQLAAVDAWNAARRAAERELAEAGATREGGLDARRRLAAVRRETDALRARSEHALRSSGELLRTLGRPRALLVHRQEWLRRALGTALEAEGVEVLASLEDGAEGVGWAVAEQPDLLLVEELLPTVSGVEVVRRTRSFSPRTVVVAQVGHEGGVPTMLDAGAHLALPRRVPPAELSRALLDAVSVR
jgi:CheY-like chemotaxis protein